MPVDERTFVADVAGWVTAILEGRTDLPYSHASVEEHGVGSQKRHDFLLYRRGANRVALTGEVKMPDSPLGRSPFDAELVGDAFEKASRRGVPYYFTWNVRDFVLFETHRADVPFMERRMEGPTRVGEVSVSDDVRRPEVQEAIRSFWEGLLERLAALEAGRRPFQNLPLDRRFIVRIEGALEDPIAATQDELARRRRTDADFRARLDEWMRAEQGWDISEVAEPLRRNLERAARLSCYMLLTRLVFYQVLRRMVRHLAPLGGIQLNTPEELAQALDARFTEAIAYSKDYQTIFETSDFGNTLPLLAQETPRAWLKVIESIEDFDFSKLDYEVIGRLYEQLIGPAERRRYGQYYTSPDVVDLINAFCIRSPEARVLDPACGSGTFLVRGYARKRALSVFQSQDIAHRELLGQLYGTDINAFPVQLSTINLAIRHLSDEPNYPQVAKRDFFHVNVGRPFHYLPDHNGDKREVSVAQADAVIGNPPYIRQEKLDKEEKRRIGNLLAQEWQGPDKPKLSGRSDIYAYFFAHAAAFLKPGGYLGFVTSIGWLDTDYGFRLQEFFLKNFRIIAVMESEVEKWFEDARVTTAVTILQREPDEAKRRANLVRFMHLRKPLAEIYSAALHSPISEENEAARQADMDAVRDLIEEITTNQNTHYWRVRVVSQAELWDAGCRARLGAEEEEGGAEYKAGKWGQHIRAPQVWFELLDRSGARLVPLQELAEVRRGFTSGVDKFYCVHDVTDDERRRLPDPAAFKGKWGIAPQETGQVRIVQDGVGALHLVESRFLEPEFHTLMEAKSIVIRAADVKRWVINAPISRAALRRTRLANYVAYAEAQRWHTGPTVASRARTRPWYDLGLRPKAERAQLVWPKIQQYRHLVLWNEDALPTNSSLYDVWAVNSVEPRLLWAILNSSVVALAKHQFGRVAGIEGNLQIDVVHVNMMLVPDVRQAPPEVAARAIAAAERMARRPSRNLPEEFSLSDRQELDDAVLEILGFTDFEERVALRSRLYAAVTQMYSATRTRELIAQKDRLRSKSKGVMTAADMAEELWEQHQDSFEVLQFPEDFVRGPMRGESIDLPSGPVEVGRQMFDTGRGLRAGTIRVGGPTGVSIDVGSVPRARFAAVAALCGHSGVIPMPDDAECEQAVHEFERYQGELTQRFSALAAQRTRDQRKQRAITDTLVRKALPWRRTT